MQTSLVKSEALRNGHFNCKCFHCQKKQRFVEEGPITNLLVVLLLDVFVTSGLLLQVRQRVADPDRALFDAVRAALLSLLLAHSQCLEPLPCGGALVADCSKQHQGHTRQQQAAQRVYCATAKVVLLCFQQTCNITLPSFSWLRCFVSQWVT